jgi:hypothetical protein
LCKDFVKGIKDGLGAKATSMTIGGASKHLSDVPSPKKDLVRDCFNLGVLARIRWL